MTADQIVKRLPGRGVTAKVLIAKARMPAAVAAGRDVPGAVGGLPGPVHDASPVMSISTRKDAA